MIEYRRLEEKEICRELFGQFIRRQEVGKCWRRVDGEWVIRDDPFVDDWTEEDYRKLVACLQNTLATGGFVYAAFRDGALKGFASVEAALFGGEQGYLDLSSIHVSQDMRGQGVGRTLFLAAKGWARERGAEAVHLRPLRRGEPGLLQGHGLRGGGSVPPGACGRGALRLPVGVRAVVMAGNSITPIRRVGSPDCCPRSCREPISGIPCRPCGPRPRP